MKNFKHLAVLAAFISIAFVSCSDDDDPIQEEANYSSYLNNIALNVAVNNYNNLKMATSATLDKKQRLLK